LIGATPPFLLRPRGPALLATLESFNLILAGAVLAVVSLLSFPLGVSLSILLVPLLFHLRPVFLLLASPLALALVVVGPQVLEQVWEEWQLLATWFLPVMTTVVQPLFYQVSVK
jgi:hypothetical protein